MRKVILTVLIAFVAAVGLQAQDAFAKGDKVLNFGVGFGSYLGDETGYRTTVPPVSLSLDFGVKDGLLKDKASIGVGGYLGYTANRWEYPLTNYKIDYSHFILGAKGHFHYQFVKKLDTYAGLLLGYNIVSAEQSAKYVPSTLVAKASGFTYSAFLGAKYYFTPKVGAFLDLGYGIAAVELGLSLKI
jgi:hypothetical protein